MNFDLSKPQLTDGSHLGIVHDSLDRTADFGVNVAETALDRAVRDA